MLHRVHFRGRFCPIMSHFEKPNPDPRRVEASQARGSQLLFFRYGTSVAKCEKQIAKRRAKSTVYFHAVSRILEVEGLDIFEGYGLRDS